MLRPSEVSRGLVILFDPEELLAAGARPDITAVDAVQGPHFFVCLGRWNAISLWAPAFSRWTPGRRQLFGKSGSRSWIEGDSYIDQSQPWLVPDAALTPVVVSRDRSDRLSRNRVSLRWLWEGEQPSKVA